VKPTSRRLGSYRRKTNDAHASFAAEAAHWNTLIAKVEPLTTARALRGPYDYRLPPEMAPVEVGTVLLVPFGHRRVLGVVVELASSSALPPERLAEPIEALEAGTPPDLVRLGLRVAREYCSTPARGLDLVLPPGTGSARGQTRPRFELVAEATAEGAKALAGDARLGARQRTALAELVAEGGELGSAELDARGLARDALRRLERRGLVRLRDREVARRPRTPRVGALAAEVTLDDAQRAAVDRIVSGLDGAGGELLLHGVTGSGKTEVYLAAAREALERGRAALVLVPEIGLTPQTASRFAGRLGDRVAVMHSGLSEGERRDEWERLRRGEARVCVGPRSAAFAPLDGLGLVVIDEEHDASYKQEGDPRYDAREVARWRAADAGAILCLGSATPRPESWYALERLELPERADGRSLPGVEVLDMRGDARGRTSGPLHAHTRTALAALADRGAKAIVLLNRRGFAPHLDCRSCGRAWGCPECDVSLVLHRRAGRLRCHHCGHEEEIPQACPDCGSVTLARHGAGTERLEDALAELVAPAPVFRLDSDSAARAGGHLEVLERFQAASSGVLVGTQMVAKGHDFHDVVLSVVVDADATLRFPDFRAEERTFALVSQLAGRSGRGEGGGTVVVQTLAPEAEAIRHAAAHDAPGFLAGELERRRALRYPPFSHLVRIEVSCAEAGRAGGAIERVAERLSATAPAGAEVLGPAPRFRLRGRHRRQLLVKAPERAPAVDAVREAVEGAAAARELRGVALSVDVDPQ
jgi:primosomal protein N' (replication factor Y) (superfamily II helicase)